jgi:uncharacterized membrane protein (DUF2068 family)
MAHAGEGGVRIIAVFKLLKGLLLLAAGIGAMRLMHKDVADLLVRWAEQLHIDPAGRLVERLAAGVSDVDDRRLLALGIGMLFYAGLLLTEGVGLLRGKRWAEYLTVIATALLIPLEIYEIIRRMTLTRVTALVVNAAIVWYLIGRLRGAKAENR